MNPGILVDLTKCIGCRACALACKEVNELDRQAPLNVLSARTWLTVEKRNGISVRRQCMHCIEPACASACPVGALEKTQLGAWWIINRRIKLAEDNHKTEDQDDILKD